MTKRILSVMHRLTLALILALCAGVRPGIATADLSSVTRFNIAPQGLPSALLEYSQQSGVQVTSAAEAIEGKSTRGVAGMFAARGALEALLAGTGLHYEVIDPNTVAIRARAASPDTTASRSSIDNKSASSDEKAQRSFSDRFRVAHVDPAANSASAALAGSASSSDTSTNNPGLEEIVVSSYKYLNIDTSGTTNLPLPIEKVPQSISLVSNDFIEAADLKTLGAIAEYTPGAINVGNPENSGSAIKLRGFTPGRTVDGINVIQLFTYYEPDYAIFDRLEVVKGPSSVVYGVSSPGGTVNYVTKSATRETPDYLYVQAGSWSAYRVEGQVAGALTADGRARAIGVAVYDRGDSFVHDLYHEKISLYGGVNLDLTDSVTAFLHGGYERFERPTFDGIPTEADGSPAPVPRSFFIGSQDIKTTSSVYHAEGNVTWHATDRLDFSLKGNYERADTTGWEDYACCLQPNGDISLTVARLDESLGVNYGIGLSSLYKLDSLGLKDSFLSLAALYQNSRFDGVTPLNSGTGNLFAGETSIAQALEALRAGPLTPQDGPRIYADVLTLSGQSVLQLASPLSLLLGISYSKPNVTAINYGVEQGSSKDSRVSYRSGLTYEFLPRTNAYVSFSQSFTPQPRQTVDLAVLPPLLGEQYEGGLKYRSTDGRLLLSGAVFQIRQKNLAVYATTINSIDFYTTLPEVTHRGVELQALGQVTPAWQINAGYAYLDPKITGALAGQEGTVDQTELYLPKQTMSLYTAYTLHSGFGKGISFGGGVRYVGPQRTSYESPEANLEAQLTPTRNLPGYTLVDATLSYSLGPWLVQLNGHNIFDRHYLINNYQTLFYGNMPGDPASIALSVRRKF